METERIRVPYRLGTHRFCEYEDDGSPVLMGDMVTVPVFGYDGSDYEESGELFSVRYDEGGFIICVSLYREREDSIKVMRSVPCDGVFYRMEGDDANQ